MSVRSKSGWNPNHGGPNLDELRWRSGDETTKFSSRVSELLVMVSPERRTPALSLIG